MSETSIDSVEEFDVEEYQARHTQPSGTESALLTILMFVGLLVFTVGCTMLGWFD